MSAKRVLLLLPWGVQADNDLKAELTRLLSPIHPDCKFQFLEVGPEYKSACKQQGWTPGQYDNWPRYVATSRVAGEHRYDFIVIAEAEETSRQIADRPRVFGWHIGPINLKLISAMHGLRGQSSYLLSRFEKEPKLIELTDDCKIECYTESRGERKDVHGIILFQQTPPIVADTSDLDNDE